MNLNELPSHTIQNELCREKGGDEGAIIGPSEVPQIEPGTKSVLLPLRGEIAEKEASYLSGNIFLKKIYWRSEDQSNILQSEIEIIEGFIEATNKKGVVTVTPSPTPVDDDVPLNLTFRRDIPLNPLLSPKKGPVTQDCRGGSSSGKESCRSKGNSKYKKVVVVEGITEGTGTKNQESKGEAIISQPLNGERRQSLRDLSCSCERTGRDGKVSGVGTYVRTSHAFHGTVRDLLFDRPQQRAAAEVDHLSLLLSQKEADIALWKAEQASKGTMGEPGAMLELQNEKAQLKAENTALRKQVKDLIQQMFCDQHATNERNESSSPSFIPLFLLSSTSLPLTCPFFLPLSLSFS
ncbi:hypothetical protein HAX54_015101 [Datura stramonium]|uniref:Uncharacterized protein n=1 Tax=Datura stramonium TaxID=4076 RepID=A0ABS8TSE3_DATST|nr:hypothetical protein [Datura stramonium]